MLDSEYYIVMSSVEILIFRILPLHENSQSESNLIKIHSMCNPTQSERVHLKYSER